RTPVSDTRKTVAICVPVPLFVVTVNGSAVQAAELVALHTTALPPGPFVLVKMSGCAATIVSGPRITVPLLLMTIGKLPGPKPIGTTNLICPLLTAYKPHAAPLMATETPFNSTGNAGARFDSEALALLTVAAEGARL